MFLTMFSTFAKSEISKYGHSSENAKGNIILINCALEKIRIPILVEHFLKPVQINSLIESSVIVWRRRSAFQILIQKGHMLVYVPKIFDISERIQDSSEISMPELFSKSIFWIWIIGSDCKLKLAQIPEKAQKSLLNNCCKKNLKTHFPISLCFECSEYWLQLRRRNQEKQDSSENWLAGLTFFLFVLTYILNPQAKKRFVDFSWTC